jgi:hypothetical protein
MEAVKENFRKIKTMKIKEKIVDLPSVEVVKKDDLLALYGSSALLLYKRDVIDGSRLSDDARARLAADIGNWQTLDPRTFKEAKMNFINNVLDTLAPDLESEEKERLKNDVGHWEDLEKSRFDEAKNSWQEDFIKRSMVMTWDQYLLITPHKVVVHFGLALASFINARLFAREFEHLEANSKTAYQRAKKNASGLPDVEEDVCAPDLEKWMEKKKKAAKHCPKISGSIHTSLPIDWWRWNGW